VYGTGTISRKYGMFLLEHKWSFEKNELENLDLITR